MERVAFETGRQLIVGNVALPPAGYQSRFSDSLNRGDTKFIPLTDVSVTSLEDGSTRQQSFVVLSKRQIHLAYPAEG